MILHISVSVSAAVAVAVALKAMDPGGTGPDGRSCLF